MKSSQRLLAFNSTAGVEHGSARRETAIASFIRHKPLGSLGGFIVLILVGVALVGPIVAPYDPLAVSLDRLQPPISEHLLGTDHYGRDVLSRVLHGAWVSLYIGLGSAIVCTLVATLIGLVSGYFGGAVDASTQRSVDAVMALPLLLLVLVAMMIVKASMTSLPLALGVIYGIRTSRVVRSSVLVVKEFPYVDAAHAIGCPTWRIMWFHVLRNVFAPIIVIATLVWGQAILVEATVSFLGFGVPPPLPSWGRMISESRSYLESAPWTAVFPGLAITLAVYGFNMVGDAIRDVLDPRLRQ